MFQDPVVPSSVQSDVLVASEGQVPAVLGSNFTPLSA
jgi:hypothetical protein